MFNKWQESKCIYRNRAVYNNYKEFWKLLRKQHFNKETLTETKLPELHKHSEPSFYVFEGTNYNECWLKEFKLYVVIKLKTLK